MKTAIILGAGFSKCASLPTQNEFPQYFVSEELSDNHLHKSITKIIKQFLKDVFCWSDDKIFPTLEDYFTCLDLSANSGNNLGFYYTPKKLRAIRRITIYRIFQILDYQYKRADEIELFMKNLFENGNPSFVVTNWDIVLERVLIDLGNIYKINYGFECYDWASHSLKTKNENDIIISKMHGSSNWIYCETCTKIFFDLYRKLALHEKVGIFKSDFSFFNEANAFINPTWNNHVPNCPSCGNKTLSSHIATFSYKKSYRTFAYPVIWHNSQLQLSESDEWIFIGYSLPDSDYEFKHMLKSSELSLKRKADKEYPKIKVILKDDKNAENRYLNFFGERINKDNIYQKGLKDYVNNILRIGV